MDGGDVEIEFWGYTQVSGNSEDGLKMDEGGASKIKATFYGKAVFNDNNEAGINKDYCSVGSPEVILAEGASLEVCDTDGAIYGVPFTLDETASLVCNPDSVDSSPGAICTEMCTQPNESRACIG